MRIWFNKTFSTINAVFNNLRLAGKPGAVTVICTHTHSTASAFLAANESYLEPSAPTGHEYLDWCLAFCQSHRIDIFWPGKEAAFLSQHHAQFHAIGVQVMSVADYETLNLLNDKAQFYTELDPDIAQTMEFIAVDNLDEFDRAVAQLSTRHNSLCIKPSVSVFGLGFRILDTRRDSITHLIKGVEYEIPLQELRQGMMNTRHFDTMLVMEHLGGHEWSVDCAGRHGELLCAVQRRKSLLLGHGQEIDNNAEITGMVERLTGHYRLNGLFNIQFKNGKDGPRLLEINPRPSGGFGMSCLAGTNLAKLALQAFKGEKISVPEIHYGLKIAEINTPVVLRDDL